LLARCGDCEEQRIPTLLSGGELVLEEGFYTLEFTMMRDAVVKLEIRSESVGP